MEKQMENRVYLDISTKSSEYGLPTIFIDMANASLEQTLVKECQKYLPYRLCEFATNFTVTAIVSLLLAGFEVIVNLKCVQNIYKIPRAAKIRLTLNLEDDYRGIELFNHQEEVIFKNVKTKEDIEKLKDILTETMTRARVYVKQPSATLITEYKKLILSNKLPVSILERK